jgi:hypothetical protein
MQIMNKHSFHILSPENTDQLLTAIHTLRSKPTEKGLAASSPTTPSDTVTASICMHT